ncbi:MAG: hypothetical protein A2Y71_03745 [Bacteroidetes bacterium RBG_13_42_15]|nr:MAG: hypothetical protein A2Y71_03745 [Bacteroidetes bacterium RBG_13_42_15]
MTTETKRGINITGRDIGVIIAMLSIIIGGVTKFERQQVQIEQIRAEWEKYPPAVMYTNQLNMSKDISEIKTDMKTLVVAVNKFMLEDGR